MLPVQGLTQQAHLGLEHSSLRYPVLLLNSLRLLLSSWLLSKAFNYHPTLKRKTSPTIRAPPWSADMLYLIYLLDFSTMTEFIEDKVFVPLVQYDISSTCNLLHNTAPKNSINKLMTVGLQRWMAWACFINNLFCRLISISIPRFPTSLFSSKHPLYSSYPTSNTHTLIYNTLKFVDC